MLLMLSAILILLLMSAFFSGSETALTGASNPLMHQLENKGNHRAHLVNRLRERKGRLIGSILIGNNLVNILATSLATSMLIGVFGEAGVVYATVIMTALVVLFAEIMPKTYALLNADRMALALAPPLKPLVSLFSPLTVSTLTLVRWIFSLFGIRLRRDDSFASSAEELRGAIELHAEQDAITEERAMLHSVLDLAAVDVGEIMVHRKTVVMINADESPSEILDQVLASPHTRLPLWRGDQDNVIGILHAKEILRALRNSDDPTQDLDFEALITEPWFIPETTRLLDQLQAFRDRREHFALVIDEYGSLMGVVTLEDILEEIVGDIIDEHDIPLKGIQPQPDGSFIIDGEQTIRDLNRDLDWNLPDDQAATLAGLVLYEARLIPEVGQSFMFFDFRFEILRRHRNQITSVRVTPPAVKEKPEGAGG